VPGLLILAGQDRIIDNDAVEKLLGRSRATMETVVYDDQTHSIQFDAPRRLVADMSRWIAARRIFDGGADAAP
jgi:alpha-beta hydrolase superfamily lysophospholipase